MGGKRHGKGRHYFEASPVSVFCLILGAVCGVRVCVLQGLRGVLLWLSIPFEVIRVHSISQYNSSAMTHKFGFSLLSVLQCSLFLFLSLSLSLSLRYCCRNTFEQFFFFLLYH